MTSLDLRRTSVQLTAPMAVLEYVMDVCVQEIEFWEDEAPQIGCFTEDEREAMARGWDDLLVQLSEYRKAAQ